MDIEVGIELKVGEDGWVVIRSRWMGGVISHKVI
jgi:hypothetical protein